ncbi:hypothetical protein BGZ65_010075, partial [Modicella reniformis]
ARIQLASRIVVRIKGNFCSLHLRMGIKKLKDTSRQKGLLELIAGSGLVGVSTMDPP